MYPYRSEAENADKKYLRLDLFLLPFLFNEDDCVNLSLKYLTPLVVVTITWPSTEPCTSQTLNQVCWMKLVRVGKRAGGHTQNKQNSRTKNREQREKDIKEGLGYLCVGHEVPLA